MSDADAEQQDQRIRDLVHERLTLDPEVEGTPVAVSVREGVVVLEGTARPYARAAAERVARETPGVRRVENRVDIRDPLALGGDDLREMVRRALAEDPAIPHERIEVAVRDGIVELTGIVASAADRAAIEGVLDIPGIVDVKNRVAVEPVGTAEADLAGRIADAFVAAARAAAAGIEVRLVDGRATLRGHVPDPVDRRRAEQVALATPGVAEVVNEIAVEAR